MRQNIKINAIFLAIIFLSSSTLSVIAESKIEYNKESTNNYTETTGALGANDLTLFLDENDITDEILNNLNYEEIENERTNEN